MSDREILPSYADKLKPLRLSALQKTILVVIGTRVDEAKKEIEGSLILFVDQGYPAGFVFWDLVASYFSDERKIDTESPAFRASMSRALKRLEERKLIVRHGFCHRTYRLTAYRGRVQAVALTAEGGNASRLCVQWFRDEGFRAHVGALQPGWTYCSTANKGG